MRYRKDKKPSASVATANDKRAQKAAKFKVMENIILDGQKILNEFGPSKYKHILRARPAIILRKRCAPLRALPASWWYWGKFFLGDCKLPLALFLWNKPIGKKTIQNIVDGIRAILRAMFGHNGA